MFQSRLQPRLRELKMDSFESYCNYIFQLKNKDAELSAMIDLVSTNKTEFFREKDHFDLIRERVLPELLDSEKKVQDRFIRCWSAGCSNGQEAYSLAMVLEDYRQQCEAFVDFHILGTDVSSRVLKLAKEAIYPFEQSTDIPMDYLKRFVLKSKDQTNPRIKIMKSLHTKVDFKYSNLMDKDYKIKQQFHLIFIRNTLIYFDQENQFQILKRIINHLLPGGYLFIGHSESLINLDLPIQIISPSVYQKI